MGNEKLTVKNENIEQKKPETVAEAITEVGKFWVESTEETKRLEINLKYKHADKEHDLNKQRLWIFSIALFMVFISTVTLSIFGLVNTGIATILSVVGTVSVGGIGFTLGGNKKD